MPARPNARRFLSLADLPGYTTPLGLPVSPRHPAARLTRRPSAAYLAANPGWRPPPHTVR